MNATARPAPAALLEQLKSLLGPAGWLDDPASLERYLVDHRRLYRGATPLVARPL